MSEDSAPSRDLLRALREEASSDLPGGILAKLQVEFTYNSNRIEGGRLDLEQTRLLYTDAIVYASGGPVSADDVVEAVNHFLCVHKVIRNAGRALSEHLIKDLHRTLKNGTSDSRKSWFEVGDYKRLPNEVGNTETVPPAGVPEAVRRLIDDYESLEKRTLEDVLDLHVRFERIHPFQDGNGRVGRLIMFKECLRNGIVPFVIDSDHKMFYYRGLQEWGRDRAYLLDTCLSAQDTFKGWLDYFRIRYRGARRPPAGIGRALCPCTSTSRRSRCTGRPWTAPTGSDVRRP